MNAVEIMQQLLANAEFIDMTRIMEEGMPYWPTQIQHLKQKQLNLKN